MKCNQSRPGFELMSSCPHPATITITPWAPPNTIFYRCLLRNIDKLVFRVYHRPSRKNDYIYFYSHHNTKKGVIIGFYLRDFCIFSPKYLNNQSNYIENSFLNLHYSKHFIHFAKFKALKIHNKNLSQIAINTPSDRINPQPLIHFILLNNSSSYIIGNDFNKLSIKTVTVSYKTICNLLHLGPQSEIISDVSVHCILC